eukprot:scaffold140238_cov17-Prasinocladus_malaysianus.AAC.1
MDNNGMDMDNNGLKTASVCVAVESINKICLEAVGRLPVLLVASVSAHYSAGGFLVLCRNNRSVGTITVDGCDGTVVTGCRGLCSMKFLRVRVLANPSQRNTRNEYKTRFKRIQIENESTTRIKRIQTLAKTVQNESIPSKTFRILVPFGVKSLQRSSTPSLIYPPASGHIWGVGRPTHGLELVAHMAMSSLKVRVTTQDTGLITENLWRDYSIKSARTIKVTTPSNTEKERIQIHDQKV